MERRVAGPFFIISKTLFVLSLGVLLAGCQKQLGGGTAEGIGGTDPVIVALDGVHARVAAQWQQVSSIPSSEALCDFAAYCANETHPLCGSFPALSNLQAQYCSNFIRSMAASALDAVQSPNIQVTPTDDPLEVDGQLVTAKTELSPTGKIWISAQRSAELNLTSADFIVILTHEFLHKTPYQSVFLDDPDDLGPFSGISGAGTLFTAVGYALALRDVLHKNIQVGGTLPAAGFLTAGMTSFNGQTIHPAISSSTALTAPDDFAWTFLVQVTGQQDDLGNFSNVLFYKGADSGGYPYGCEVLNHLAIFDEGRIECGLRENSSLFSFTLRSNFRLNDGKVHLVSFVRRDNALRIYVDGQLDAQRSSLTAFGPSANNSQLQLGNRLGKQRFKGNLGIMHFWQMALYSSHLNQLEELLEDLLPGLLSLLGV